MPSIGDHNSWASWRSQQQAARFHPDAPRGGTGDGFSRETAEAGACLDEISSVASHSPVGYDMLQEETVLEFAAAEFSSLSASIRMALTWSTASALARGILGLRSFGLAAGEALADALKQSGASVLRLQRELLYADLHDLLTGKICSARRLDSESPSWASVGRKLMWSEPSLSSRQLEQAVKTRKAFVQEVASFLWQATPKPAAEPDWVALMMEPAGKPPEALHEAGREFGKALAQCLSTLTEARPAAPSSKVIAAAFPNLTKAAEQLRAGSPGGAVSAKPVVKSSLAPVAIRDSIVDSGQTPSDFARSWQGNGDYPGVDGYEDIILKKDTIIYGGTPGQSHFYTTQEAVEKSGGSASALFSGLQVKPHPKLGYRTHVTAYRVTQDTPAAFGQTLANPQFGAGGNKQIVIENFRGCLEPLNTTNLTI